MKRKFFTPLLKASVAISFLLLSKNTGQAGAISYAEDLTPPIQNIRPPLFTPDATVTIRPSEREDTGEWRQTVPYFDNLIALHPLDGMDNTVFINRPHGIEPLVRITDQGEDRVSWYPEIYMGGAGTHFPPVTPERTPDELTVRNLQFQGLREEDLRIGGTILVVASYIGQASIEGETFNVPLRFVFYR